METIFHQCYFIFDGWNGGDELLMRFEDMGQSFVLSLRSREICMCFNVLMHLTPFIVQMQQFLRDL